MVPHRSSYQQAAPGKAPGFMAQVLYGYLHLVDETVSFQKVLGGYPHRYNSGVINRSRPLYYSVPTLLTGVEYFLVYPPPEGLTEPR